MNFGYRATGEVLLCGRRVLSGREEVHRLGDLVSVETTGLEARRLLSKLHFRPGRVQQGEPL